MNDRRGTDVDEVEPVPAPTGDVGVYCLAKPGAWSDQPWEGDTVAKVGPKTFVFLGSDGRSLGLKCGRDRDEADELIARYPGSVTVMPYIGRYGWNTVTLDGRIDVDDLFELIDASYDAVVAAFRASTDPPPADRPQAAWPNGWGRRRQSVDGEA